MHAKLGEILQNVPQIRALFIDTKAKIKRQVNKKIGSLGVWDILGEFSRLIWHKIRGKFAKLRA